MAGADGRVKPENTWGWSPGVHRPRACGARDRRTVPTAMLSHTRVVRTLVAKKAIGCARSNRALATSSPDMNVCPRLPCPFRRHSMRTRSVSPSHRLDNRRTAQMSVYRHMPLSAALSRSSTPSTVLPMPHRVKIGATAIVVRTFAVYHDTQRALQIQHNTWRCTRACPASLLWFPWY